MNHGDAGPDDERNDAVRSEAELEVDEVTGGGADVDEAEVSGFDAGPRGEIVLTGFGAGATAAADDARRDVDNAFASFDLDAPVHRVAADLRGRTLTESEYRTLSRRSVLTGAAGTVAALLGWRWVQGRPDDERIPDVLRKGHELNERIWRALFRDGAEAPTFDYARSSVLRVNGRHGLSEPLDVDGWRLRVVGLDGEVIGSHSIDDLRVLEPVEMTVEHKCVEGWSHIVTWGGVRFSDFVARYHPEQADAPFVGLATPDDVYRVGLERAAMMHRQTLLTMELQREPLTEEHGAPVRLTTPLKYGIKQIKRIGTIEFSATQPPGDYWTSRGYDWYAGL